MTLAERLALRPAAQRRALAAVGMLVAGLLVWGLLIRPMYSLITSQATWRERAGDELGVLRGKSALESQLTAQIESLKSAPVWTAFYLTPNDGDATEQISRDLVALAAGMGIASPTLVPLPRRDREHFVVFAVRFSAAMTAEQLRKFCVALRQAPHFLRIEHLEAQAPQLQEPDSNPALNVVLQIDGYAPKDAHREATKTPVPREPEGGA